MERLPKDQSKPTMELHERVSALRGVVDIDQCLKAMNGARLTERQKMERLYTMWVTMEAFVDIGFGEHPCQRSEAIDCLQMDISNAIERIVRRKTGKEKIALKF